MLSATSRSPLPSGRLVVAWLAAAGALACAIPTFRSAALSAPPQAAASETLAATPAEAPTEAPAKTPADEPATTPERPTTLEQWANLTDEEADAITTRHLRALAVAVHVYADDHDGQLPPRAVPNAALPPEKRLSGLVLLLPYLGKRPSYLDPEAWRESGLDQEPGQEALYHAIDRTKAWDDPANRNVAKTVVPGFLSPRGGPLLDQQGYAVSHFAFVRGAEGEDDGAYPEGGGIVFWPAPEDRTKMLADGSVNILGIGQIRSHFGPWIAAGPSTSRYVYHPSDSPREPTFGGIEKDACYFATCDAAIHFVDMAGTEKTMLRYLTARADGHPIDWHRLTSVHRSRAEWKAPRDEPE